MQSIQNQLNGYREKGRRLKKWKKIVTALACVVVFCTVYALILPAITLEGNTYCDKEEHTHSDECYKEAVAGTEKKLVCTKEEVEPHTHSDGCYEIRTVEVPVEETIEVPAEEAEPAAVSETTEGAEPAAVSETTEGAEPAAVSETPATKTVTVTKTETKEEQVLVCEKAETEGHAHGNGCYEEVEVYGDPELDCSKEEHNHSKSCYSNPNADVETEAEWKKTFDDVTFTNDWVVDTLAIAKTQLGYNESNDNYIVLENGDTKGYTRYGEWYGDKYGDWCAMFVSFCLNYAEVEDFPLEAGCQNWILKIKELEEASKDEDGVVQYNAWQEATEEYIPEKGNVIFFNWDSAADSDHVGIVVGTTTDEEGKTTITTIEGNASDTVKYKEYDLENQTIMGYGILPAQEFYCGMQGHAHDEDCYDEANELVCEIEEHIHIEECEEKSELTEEEQAEVDAVIAAIDALPTADEFDAKLLEYEEAEDMESYEAYWTEIQTQCQEAYAMYEELSETQKTYVTNIDKLMELEWLWSVETYVHTNNIDSDAVTIAESASTSEFVELNVFDYYGNRSNKPSGMVDINNRWQNVDDEYPGYQWNAGAYPYRYYSNAASTIDSSYGWIADRNLVDCIDFGNSLITDYEITSSLYEPDFGTWVSTNKYAGDASPSRISVASSSGANGAINAIDWGNGTGNTDRPIGYSSEFGLSIGNKLGADGYPELKKSALYGKSLKYLFYDDPANNFVYADKKNSVSVDGLFQQDPISGEYTFDSRRNHAQYDDENDRFILYDQTITPNFILYPFGNFLPFNDITNENYATQVQAFDYQGGVRDYFQTMLDRMYYPDTMSLSQRQLYRMLVSYKYNWMNWPDSKAGNGRKWDTITAANAINDYFNNSNEFSDEGWNFETDERLQNIMTELYNIDYDVETNFFFGMEMKMNFMMPKDGMTGNDVTGDGKSDFPMKFVFEGDDDVWVYIDGILFLDLTGIHRHVGGEIDFVNGMVHYYQMESYVDGEVEDTPYYSMSFADVLTEIGGVSEADLGNYLKYEDGKYTTFKDYSTHDFNFYYMERGSGSSVCRINFNFPLLRKNSVSVTKELSPDADVNVMGNPDYYFNIVTPGNELFVGPNSKTNVTTYTILDSGGNEIGTGETDEYGIFALKAGQTAVFEGVEENEGEFFVQELIKEEDNGQYSKVYVNGGEARYAQLIDWSYRTYFSDSDGDKWTGPYGYKWYGHSGEDTDSSTNSAFYFEADNGVNTSALGKLSITKNVENIDGTTSSDNIYKMHVILDTKPIPVGTKYIVASADGTQTEKNVEEVGCIEVKAGETATISNILSGTVFTVEEDSGSAKGYTVVYTAPTEIQEEISSDGTGITGVVRNNATVEVLVTNTENGTTLSIPVQKVIANPNDQEHTFKFQLQEVDKDGNELTPSGKVWEATETVKDSRDFVFALNYFEKNIDSLPATYYYKLTEVAGENANIKYDATEYLIEVKVSKENKDIKAEIVDVKKDNVSMKVNGALPETLSLEFTNTLLEDLILEKQLKGTTLDSDKAFKFAVTLKDTNGSPLTGSYKVTNSDVTQEKVLDDKGTFQVEVNAGSSIEIHDLPLGTLWSITELEADGYWVSRTIKTESTESTDIESAESKEASGTMKEQTTVTFVNQTTYELPETGGIGTNPFIIGGAALMCIAMFLLYNNKKRGKEETASS